MTKYKHSNSMAWLALAYAISAAVPVQSASAQGPMSAQGAQIMPAATRQCNCGRWTCPACQQQRMQTNCPPGQSIMPMTPGVLPAVPTEGGTVRGPGGPASPTSPSDQAAMGNVNPNAAANQLGANTNTNQPPFGNANDISNSLAQSSSQRNYGGLNSGGIADPAMMGDYFGPAGNSPSIITQCTPGSGGNFFAYIPPSCTTTPVYVPSSFSLQRMKIAENTSPIPQNRVFLNYSMFSNVPLSENGITVNRLSPGFETLLFSPNTSFEMRTPVATTLDSDIMLGGGTSTRNVEFGNLFFSLKQVLLRREAFVVSGGMSMTAPTADDVRVLGAQNDEILRIRNQSVHLMPFVGSLYKPSQNSFMQGFLQIDVDANGSPVLFSPLQGQTNLTQIGRLQDFTLLYSDLSAGYWTYRSSGRGLTGVAPMIEAHYNRSLNEADCVVDATGDTKIQSPIREYDNLNLVSALVFEFNRQSRIGVGYGVPIGNGKDRAFDGEFRLTFNRYY